MPSPACSDSLDSTPSSLLALHQPFEVSEILLDLFLGDLRDAVQRLPGPATWRRVFEAQPHFSVCRCQWG